jgi:hypothetical protein
MRAAECKISRLFNYLSHSVEIFFTSLMATHIQKDLLLKLVLVLI